MAVIDRAGEYRALVACAVSLTNLPAHLERIGAIGIAAGDVGWSPYWAELWQYRLKAARLIIAEAADHNDAHRKEEACHTSPQQK